MLKILFQFIDSTAVNPCAPRSPTSSAGWRVLSTTLPPRPSVDVELRQVSDLGSLTSSNCRLCHLITDSKHVLNYRYDSNLCPRGTRYRYCGDTYCRRSQLISALPKCRTVLHSSVQLLHWLDFATPEMKLINKPKYCILYKRVIRYLTLCTPTY